VLARVKAEKTAKRKAFRTTPWSDASGVVSIPLAGNVYVSGAKPASDRNYNDEPSTTLLVESFADDKGKATQAAKEKDFKRGAVANMTEDVDVLGTDAAQPYIDQSKNFPFRTGITIVDIDGGQPLAKDFKEPARVLLMDPAGQLFVQNETDDADAVQLHRDIFADSEKRGTRPGGREPAPGGREGGPPVPQRGFGGARGG
jgi:hypothetical protein